MTTAEGASGHKHRHPPLALLHHSVACVAKADDPAWLSVSPGRLERQLELLVGWGYSLVSFSTLARRLSEGLAENHAALTFDDGFADNLTTLVPILDRYKVSATVFVVSGWLGQTHPRSPTQRILTVAEVRDLHAAGVEIGAHTVTHPDLASLSFEQARVELADSKRALEDVIEAPVTTAAYPYGSASEGTRRACRDAGFDAACRATPEGTWSDPFDLPRQVMNTYSSQVGLYFKRDDRYETLMQRAPLRGARKLRRAALRALSR